MELRLDNVPWQLFDATRSKLQKYEQIIVGRAGWRALFRYEIIIVLACHAPSALGLWLRSRLRSRLYPKLLGAFSEGTLRCAIRTRSESETTW